MKKHVRNVDETRYGFVKLVAIFLPWQYVIIFFLQLFQETFWMEATQISEQQNF